MFHQLQSTGTDNAKINVNGNEKEGITTVLTISADGNKLKPMIIAKGKTPRCLKKYKINENKMAYTAIMDGWIME